MMTDIQIYQKQYDNTVRIIISLWQSGLMTDFSVIRAMKIMDGWPTYKYIKKDTFLMCRINEKAGVNNE